MVLVNARLSEKSLAQAQRTPRLVREAAQGFACVLAQTSADAERMVLSPCTFEWPLTQHVPAPGRPICPPTRRRFRSIQTLSTPFVCCVIPVAQQHIVAFEWIHIVAAARMCSIDRPVASNNVFQSAASTSLRRVSNPSVYLETNSRSIPDGRPFPSSSSMYLRRALIRATSPFIRTGR